MNGSGGQADIAGSVVLDEAFLGCVGAMLAKAGFAFCVSSGECCERI